MATIKLQRTSELVNMFRHYQIYIDGKNIGAIANGEKKEFPISSGQHTIIARIDWCSSQEIDFYIGETETKIFNVGGFKNGKWIIPIAIGLIVLGFALNLSYANKLSVLIAFLVFGLLIYYVSIGRKKYLTLSENI